MIDAYLLTKNQLQHWHLPEKKDRTLLTEKKKGHHAVLKFPLCLF